MVKFKVLFNVLDVIEKVTKALPNLNISTEQQRSTFKL